MARSTRTTFTASKDGPIVTVVELLSQSLAQRAQAQQAAVAQPPNAPALAAPGGRVQRLGGEPLHPRSDQATGAIPVGGVVQVNQGIRTGQPAGTVGTTQQQQPLGWLQGDGDPNEAGRVPRVRGDRYYDRQGKTLWVWQQTGPETAEWVAVVAPAILDDGPPEEPGLIDGQGYYDLAANQLYLWGDTEAEWLGPIGGAGGAVLYGNGNPNGNIETQLSAIPWAAGGQYYDLLTGRLFVSSPEDTTNDNDPTVNWLPASRVSWDAGLFATSAAASGYYPGDTYQGPADHGIEDAEGGMFYRFSSSGEWIPQFSCCEPPPKPPQLTSNCQPGWMYTFPGATYNDRYNVYFPCS